MTLEIIVATEDRYGNWQMPEGFCLLSRHRTEKGARRAAAKYGSTAVAILQWTTASNSLMFAPMIRYPDQASNGACCL